MHTRIRTLAVPLAAVLALSACGDNSPIHRLSEAKQSVDNAKNAVSAFRGMTEAAQQMAEDAEAGVTVEPVDFRKLRDLLPEKLAGLPRTSVEGQKSGTMGLTVSVANATYENDAADAAAGFTSSIEVSLTDIGGTAGMAAMALAPWMAMEIDQEDEHGYERTLKYKDYPAHEQFSGVDQGPEQMDGTVQVLVAKRFVVEVEGHGVEPDRVKDALDGLDLDRLAAMKDVGVTRQKD